MSFSTRPSQYSLINPRTLAPLRVSGLRGSRLDRNSIGCRSNSGFDTANAIERNDRESRTGPQGLCGTPSSTRWLPYNLELASGVKLPKNADAMLAKSRMVKCYHFGADERTERVEYAEREEVELEHVLESAGSGNALYPDPDKETTGPYFMRASSGDHGAQAASRNPGKHRRHPATKFRNAEIEAFTDSARSSRIQDLPGHFPWSTASSSRSSSMQPQVAPARGKTASSSDQGRLTLSNVSLGRAPLFPTSISTSGNQSTLHPGKKRKATDSDNDDEDEEEPVKKKARGRTGKPHAPHLQYDPTKTLLSTGIARPQMRASIPEILTIFPDEIKNNPTFVQRLVESGWDAGMTSAYINHTRGLAETDVGAFKRSTIAKQFKKVYGPGWTIGAYKGTPTSDHTFTARDGEDCPMADLLGDVVNLPDAQDQWDLLPCLVHAKANPAMGYTFPSDLDQVRAVLPVGAVTTPAPSAGVDVEAGKRWAKKRDEIVAKRRGGNTTA